MVDLGPRAFLNPNCYCRCKGLALSASQVDAVLATLKSGHAASQAELARGSPSLE